MKTKIFMVVFFAMGIIVAMAQSNPSSTNGVDAEMELSWPSATVYVSSINDNDSGILSDGPWSASANWNQTSGGFFSIGSDYSYEPGIWPETLFGLSADGGVASDYGIYGVGWGISIGSESGASPVENATWNYNDQAELNMLTGGAPGATGDELYELQGVILSFSFDTGDYTNIPPQQIQIGNLGNLSANRTLWALLPTRLNVVVTPSGNPYYVPGVTVSGPFQLVSQCVATNPPNQARTTIGVGEKVNMSFNPPLPTNATWSVSAGSVSLTNGPSTLFTAPSNAVTSVTVSAQVGQAKPYTMNFNVYAPTGIDHAVIIATNNIQGAPNFTSGESGAEMVLNAYFAPTNVSFYRVSVMEVGENATNLTGYFSQFTPSQLYHSSANHWTPLNQANNYSDLDSGTFSPPWSPGGSFTWNIPANWQVTGSGQTNSMANGWNQVFSIDSSGTVTIQKWGRSVTRTTNNVITTN